jgi:tight adherence protein C
VAGAVTFVVFPLLAPVAVVAAWGGPVRRGRRRARERVDAVRRSLPEVVDLLTLAVGAGLTVPLAVAAVARRHDGPVGDQLGRVTEEVARGRRCADALDDAAVRLGPDARPVVSALISSERYGAPLAEALARLATDVRADRRRRAEEAARRVPVKLLFPLVLCVLPAFALLTVAPLLAGALGSLRL